MTDSGGSGVEFGIGDGIWCLSLWELKGWEVLFQSTKKGLFSLYLSLFFLAYLGGNGWVNYYRYKIAIITANLMKRLYIIWRLYLLQLKAYSRFNQARKNNSLMKDKLLFENFYSLIHSYKNTFKVSVFCAVQWYYFLTDFMIVGLFVL